MTDATPKKPLLSLISTVTINRLVQVSSSLLAVIVMPRLLGLTDYGRFSFVQSLLYIGSILGDFGSTDVFGRFVPGMERAEAGKLYMRTAGFKVAVGLACGALSAAAALLLADWMQLSWAILIGLSVAIHVIAWAPFLFALGLNRVGVWLAEQAWRQWVLLGLLVALYPLAGLDGTLWALFSMEALFLALGFWWIRDYWQGAELRFDWPYIRPFVRFGLGFFLANIAAVALYRSGPILVELLTGDSAETGYLNLAIGLFLLAYLTISQFAQSLIPTLSGFREQGEIDKVWRWLGTFSRLWLLLGGLATVGVWLVADWLAPLAFGRDFGAAAAALKGISLGIPLTALQWSGNVLATVTGRGGVKFAGGLAALVTFVAAALLLTPLYGAAGAALALSLAVLAHVLVLWGWLPGFGRVLRAVFPKNLAPNRR